jgi:hypothetical protein
LPCPPSKPLTALGYKIPPGQKHLLSSPLETSGIEDVLTAKSKKSNKFLKENLLFSFLF